MELASDAMALSTRSRVPREIRGFDQQNNYIIYYSHLSLDTVLHETFSIRLHEILVVELPIFPASSPRQEFASFLSKKGYSQVNNPQKINLVSCII